MNLVFLMDDVICTPHEDYNNCKPIENVVEFMQWLIIEQGHYITIWCERELTAENKYITETWLTLYQIPYDRLLFDRPKDPVFVTETPSHARYYRHLDDNDIIAMMFDEWKKKDMNEYRKEMNNEIKK